MAGKSAKSKGYRKYYGKKNHEWTEQEKKIAKYGAIVLVVLLLAAIIIPRVVDNIGVLRVKDNTVQNTQDTWVLRNVGTNSKPKVYKLADVSQAAAGFTLESADRVIGQGLYNTYKADDESAFPGSYTITGAKNAYQAAAEAAYGQNMGEVITQAELTNEVIAGKNVAWYAKSYQYGAPVEEGGTGIEYYQYLFGFVEANREDSSVLVMIGGKVEDENAFVDNAELKAVLDEVVGYMTIG